MILENKNQGNAVKIEYIWKFLIEICPELEGWNLVVKENMGNTAGQCNHLKKEISINGYIFQNCDPTQTMQHEAAHAIVGPGYGHGPKWKRMVKTLGGRPERCHTYSVKPLRIHKKFLVTCLDCETYSTATKRVAESLQSRRCGKCKGKNLKVG